MDTPFLKAQHYHERAENLRRLATTEDDIQQRDRLREVADRYDRLGRELMRRRRRRAKAGKPHLDRAATHI
jgi:hypothetical protein